MRTFVIARDEAGVRIVTVLRGDDLEEMVRLIEEEAGQGFEVERVLGADLKDVVLSHPALFEERAA